MSATDFEKVSETFDILEDAEVMHVFDDVVWVSVDRQAWEDFTGTKFTDEEDEDES